MRPVSIGKQDNARARKKPSRAFIDQIEKLLSGMHPRLFVNSSKMRFDGIDRYHMLFSYARSGPSARKITKNLSLTSRKPVAIPKRIVASFRHVNVHNAR